jgi:hypothetical protein
LIRVQFSALAPALTFSKAIIRKIALGFHIITDGFQHGIAPGQFAVVYDRNKELVLLSGEMDAE